MAFPDKLEQILSVKYINSSTFQGMFSERPFSTLVSRCKQEIIKDNIQMKSTSPSLHWTTDKTTAHDLSFFLTKPR